MIPTWKSSAWFFPRSCFFQCHFNRYCFSTTMMNLTDTIILKKKFFVLIFYIRNLN